MVDVGGKPILWHIMKLYSSHGIDEFIICCGYKGYLIKEYFADYFLHMCDVTFEMKSNKMEVLTNGVEPWRVTLVDTGETTMTGGRLKRVRFHIGDETFCLTYGDGVSDVNIRELIAFHRSEGGIATLTAVQPIGRFGAFSLDHEQSAISSFKEKPEGGSGWINGGIFFLQDDANDYIACGFTVSVPVRMGKVTQKGKICALPHPGFISNIGHFLDHNALE